MDNRSNVSAPDLLLVDRLRALREKLQLSQTDIAKQMREDGIRMSQTAMSRIEKGERGLTVGEAQSFARILGTTLEEVLRDDIVDDWAADYRTALRALNIAHATAIRALDEYRKHLEALRYVEGNAERLKADPSTDPEVTKKLEAKVLTPLAAAKPLYGQSAEAWLLDAARALENLSPQPAGD